MKITIQAKSDTSRREIKKCLPRIKEIKNTNEVNKQMGGRTWVPGLFQTANAACR
jgi:hypothetical protein